MFARSRLLISVALFFSVLAHAEMATADTKPAMTLVVPRRRRVVKLAQDLCRLRGLTLICYQGNAATTDPVLHVFDRDGWRQIDLVQYQSEMPAKLVVIGDSRTVPAALLDETILPADVSRIETLDSAAIVSDLARKLDLSLREQKWLAKQHGLTITDANAGRRAYGRRGAATRAEELPPAYPERPVLDLEEDAPFEKGMEEEMRPEDK